MAVNSGPVRVLPDLSVDELDPIADLLGIDVDVNLKSFPSNVIVSQVAGLFADRPVAAVFNANGFPMEPFLYDMP